MKGLTLVFAGIAVVAGVVSGQLWNDLRKERLENRELKTLLAKARTPSQPLAPPASAALPASATPAAASSAPAAAPDQQARLAAMRDRASTLTSTISALTSSLGVGNNQDLMKDPEYRKARIAQLRLEIAKTYPGLVEELGLSEKEANQFFTMLAENQLKRTTDLTRPGEAGATQDITARYRAQQALQKEQEDAIRTMMGAGRYEQYQAYQQTRPARQQVVTMGTQLAAAGAPLSESQSRALTSVMIAEQQRQRQEPRQQIAQNPGSSNIQDRAAQLLGDSQRRQEENNQRILDAVAPQLSAKQIAVLKDQFDQQNSAMRDTVSRLQGLQQRLAPAPGAAPRP
jgi:hypothetical protein